MLIFGHDCIKKHNLLHFLNEELGASLNEEFWFLFPNTPPKISEYS